MVEICTPRMLLVCIYWHSCQFSHYKNVSTSKTWIIHLYGMLQSVVMVCITQHRNHLSTLWNLYISHILHCNDSIEMLFQCTSDHYRYIIMGVVASQITSLTIVYSTVYWGADQRKHQSSASLAFVRVMWPVNSPHKWPITPNMFPFDDVIICFHDIMFDKLSIILVFSKMNTMVRHNLIWIYMT